jgi:para-nitrobenzyl esterase
MSNTSLLAALLLAVTPAMAQTTLKPVTVRTPDGMLEGVISPDGRVKTFKGVPYAAPPVGNLRWKAPQPVVPWEGVRKASEYGHRCMQAGIFSDMIFHDPGPSEDCLHLNVWVPAGASSRPLPVMVWIYGGGFAAGATSEPRQDGGNLSKQGVIVVSMDYRLGIFGFFAHPALAEESGHNSAGNYGLMDQMAALQWVNRNIRLFGGDPDNVTIFGESAGSFSVSAQMASPLSQGLFQKAIGESGAFFGGNRPMQTMATVAPENVKFAETKLGTSSLEALRAKSAEELLKAASKPGAGMFWPIADGYFLPSIVSDIFAAGKQSHIPLLAGWNADEGSYRQYFGKLEPNAASFRAHAKELYTDQADAFLSAYPAADDVQAKRSAQDWAGDQFIAFSTWKWLEMQLTTGGAPVYRYEFDQAPPNEKPGPSAGAYHSAEIEFVFSVLSSKKLPWSPADMKLSSLMSAYWANFAKTGDPNAEGLPKWPVYAPEAYSVMHLASTPHAEPDQLRKRYQFLNSVKK